MRSEQSAGLKEADLNGDVGLRSAADDGGLDVHEVPKISAGIARLSFL
jgi:hypothetical protein